MTTGQTETHTNSQTTNITYSHTEGIPHDRTKLTRLQTRHGINNIPFV